jgi:hypothetical protein
MMRQKCDTQTDVAVRRLKNSKAPQWPKAVAEVSNIGYCTTPGSSTVRGDTVDLRSVAATWFLLDEIKRTFNVLRVRIINYLALWQKVPYAIRQWNKKTRKFLWPRRCQQAWCLGAFNYCYMTINSRYDVYRCVAHGWCCWCCGKPLAWTRDDDSSFS